MNGDKDGKQPFVAEYRIEQFVEDAAVLIDRCLRLGTYNFPSTLSQIDLHRRIASLAASKNSDVMLFY